MPKDRNTRNTRFANRPIIKGECQSCHGWYGLMSLPPIVGDRRSYSKIKGKVSPHNRKPFPEAVNASVRCNGSGIEPLQLWDTRQDRPLTQPEVDAKAAAELATADATTSDETN